MKRILITGANRGLGFGLVQACVARGDHVFATCRVPAQAVELAEYLAQNPENLTLLPLDVTQGPSIAECAAQVKAQVDGLDLLINNAAINMGDEGLSEVHPDVLLKTLQVNAVGPVLVTRYFLDLLHKGEDPKIVNVSSEAGSITNMNRFRGYAYYGSKAAENMYTRALACDPQIEGITVIAIHPGWVRTDMGGPNAHLSIPESAAGILRVSDGLRQEDSGKFYTWEGNTLPW